MVLGSFWVFCFCFFVCFCGFVLFVFLFGFCFWGFFCFGFCFHFWFSGFFCFFFNLSITQIQYLRPCQKQKFFIWPQPICRHDKWSGQLHLHKSFHEVLTAMLGRVLPSWSHAELDRFTSLSHFVFQKWHGFNFSLVFHCLFKQHCTNAPPCLSAQGPSNINNKWPGMGRQLWVQTSKCVGAGGLPWVGGTQWMGAVAGNNSLPAERSHKYLINVYGPCHRWGLISELEWLEDRYCVCYYSTTLHRISVWKRQGREGGREEGCTEDEPQRGRLRFACGAGSTSCPGRLAWAAPAAPSCSPEPLPCTGTGSSTRAAPRATPSPWVLLGRLCSTAFPFWLCKIWLYFFYYYFFTLTFLEQLVIVAEVTKGTGGAPGSGIGKYDSRSECLLT